MYDTIIVGHGPAGVSAAIYAVRAGLNVLLIGRDMGDLGKAREVENYYGFVEPLSGPELLERGLKQAERLGAKISHDEVTAVRWLDHFGVETATKAYEAHSVILATGMPRRKARIKGLTDYEGRGVSYCATCDGFFYRGKTVAVIGNGDYAFKEASELKPFASKVYLLTNGRDYLGGQDADFELIKEKISHVSGDEEKVSHLVLAGGGKVAVDGVFVAEGTASALDLALKLGLENDGKKIFVDEDQATNVPGLYAAGDCTGGLLQVAVAVGEGAKAGVAVGKYVRERKKAQTG